jgi:hypothetical protein
MYVELLESTVGFAGIGVFHGPFGLYGRHCPAAWLGQVEALGGGVTGGGVGVGVGGVTGGGGGGVVELEL